MHQAARDMAGLTALTPSGLTGTYTTRAFLLCCPGNRLRPLSHVLWLENGKTSSPTLMSLKHLSCPPQTSELGTALPLSCFQGSLTGTYTTRVSSTMLLGEGQRQLPQCCSWWWAGTALLLSCPQE